MMKKYMTPLLALFFVAGCNTSDDKQQDIPNLAAQDITNVSYGPDPEQKMDVYLPANRTSGTKVFVLVHGGGWSGGSAPISLMLYLYSKPNSLIARSSISTTGWAARTAPVSLSK